ncbi:MAG: CRISPR-associated endonuclease Cas1, partial [Casimicrobiaceae bacterium]|nr:CRISPR-associated endonuclease Cas1 [Casimicrobiaceae bacterium]
MSTLFLDRRGSRLELEGGHLRISLPEEGERSAETRRFPLGLIERIVLVARTELDSSTLAALSEAGVALVAFGGRRGERSAVLDGAPHRDAGLRIAQILAYSQPALRARLARVVVLAKLRASQRTLRHILACRPDLRKPLHDARLSLGSLREQLRSEPECDLA